MEADFARPVGSSSRWANRDHSCQRSAHWYPHLQSDHQRAVRRARRGCPPGVHDDQPDLSATMTLTFASRKFARGFSLLELMVAMAISLMLLMGVVALFVSSRASYETTERL